MPPPPSVCFPSPPPVITKWKRSQLSPTLDASLYGHTGSVKGCFGLEFPLPDELKRAPNCPSEFVGKHKRRRNIPVETISEVQKEKRVLSGQSAYGCYLLLLREHLRPVVHHFLGDPFVLNVSCRPHSSSLRGARMGLNF